MFPHPPSTMNEFPVEKLLTAEDCDGALKYGNAEKRDQTHALQNQQFSAENTTESAEERATKLVAAIAKVGLYTTLVAGLPDGDEKRTQQTALRRATDRRDELADNRTTTPVAVLIRALEVAQMEAQLVKTNTYLAEVTARKAAILAGG